ncbi:unnamed protein product [Agarophyton chilense]
MALSEIPKEGVMDENPSILSEGASVALGNVFKRLVGSERRNRATEPTKKRPKTAILGQNEEVEKALAEQAEERKRLKRAKKAKIAFENNARVIPDASTGAAFEKELLATATKGAVALFNAVSKAQKSLEEKRDSKKNRKNGPPVTRERFMEMMKAGLKNKKLSSEKDDLGNELDDGEDSDDDPNAVRTKASWLRDDYFTKGSKTLRDWDKGKGGPAIDDNSDSDEENSSQENSIEEDEDGSEEESSNGST